MFAERTDSPDSSVTAPGDGQHLHVFSHGEVRLDSGEIWAGGVMRHRLSPKATQLLVAFVARPDTVLSRDQILALAWAGQPRTDDAVTKVIAELRRSLAACVGDGVELIETLPKRGYRWNGRVGATQPGQALSKAGANRERTSRTQPLAASAIVVAALALTIVWIARPADPAPSAQDAQPWVDTARPLSASTADESSAVPSADGKRVISSEFDGAYARYVLFDRSRTGDRVRILRADEQADLLSPAWSRDERVVAYRKQTGKRCQLAALNLESQIETDLGACPPDADAHLEFSPDGDALIVSGHVVSMNGESNLRLLRISMDTGARGEFQFNGRPLHGKDMRYAPDGQSALVRQFDRFESLQWIDFARMTRRQVLADAAQISGYDFDGTTAHALFAAELDGKRSLWRLGLAEGDLVQMPYVDATQPRVARSSATLVFRAEARHKQLVQQTERGESPAFESTRSEFAPAESPDGRWLAFLSDRTGSTQIFLADQATDKLRRLTNYNGPVPESVTFTADSRELLVQLRMKRLHLRTEVIDLASGQTRNLALEQAFNIDLRPGPVPGQFLYTAFVAGRPHSFAHDERSGKSTLLTRCEGRAPRLGADQWLYFLSPDQRSLRRARPAAGAPCETVGSGLSADQVRDFASAATFEPAAFMRGEPAQGARFLAQRSTAQGDLMWVAQGRKLDARVAVSGHRIEASALRVAVQ